jgi:hypothetical protein
MQERSGGVDKVAEVGPSGRPIRSPHPEFA